MLKYLFLSAATLMLFSCTKTDISSTNDNAVSGSAVNTTGNLQTADGGFEIVPNEVLIRFKETATTAQKNNALNNISAAIVEHIHTNAMKRKGLASGVFLVKTNINALDAIKKIKGDASIEYAEPNYIYQHADVSNDPYITNGSLWGMNSGGYGTGATTAWANGKTGSSSVYIGIIDEGVMNTHADIQSNFGVNPKEIAANGKDDDGNGYIDDVYGWDFDGNNNSIFDGTGDDHGTHVAGTIGGVGGNGLGVAGINWKVKLLSAKFLGSRGGTTANAIKAVDYFTALKLNGLNIVATNNSWGGGGFSQGLQDAIERANNAGILFVVAAGNSTINIDATQSYPASYPNSNIIAVAAITSTGALASYSNYGATMVDIGAPGSDIWSTIPVASRKTIVSGYATYNGTSMATPHVTGACALYASIYPGTSAAAIKSAILSSAISTASLTGKVQTGGRLNVSGF